MRARTVMWFLPWLVLASQGPLAATPTIGGCNVFPANNYWNTPIDTLPVHGSSGIWVSTIGVAAKLHPDWGTDPNLYGIPFVTVNGAQPLAPIVPNPDPDFDYSGESDPGPYPIPPTAPVEGAPDAAGDRHVIVIDTSNCRLYELYRAFFIGGGPDSNSWQADSFVNFDLNSNALRTPDFTSADAAGLPIFPGLMRWEEVAAGEVAHAIRFTAAQIWGREAGNPKYLWPARHNSGISTTDTRPPMGARFRLKASFDISGYSAPTQTILRAFKKYGLVLADGGSNWFFQGVSSASWPEAVLDELKSIAGGNFEAVDTSVLMVDVNSAQAVVPAAAELPRLGNISTRMQVLTGDDVMIGGFVIGGSAGKTVVVRARGPSLVPFGIANALQNPTLQLVRSADQVTLATNDDWGNAPNAAAITASGFAPGNAQESAILMSLPPGAYTAIVSGVSGGTGVGIVEVFEVDSPGTPLVNISTRGRVLTGNDVMIGGFVIQGNFPQTVVVRARGPSLVPFGIANALANPVLQLVRSSDQATLATNDNWGSAVNASSIAATGFAPSDPLEAAILVTLPPGAYTAIVTGAGGATGVGIVEVFQQ